MHRSIGVVVMALLMVSVAGAAGAGVVGASHVASASIADQTSGGQTVVVEDVYLPEGGFVAVHDASLNNGGEDVLTSVRGTSAYLEPGNHSNVTVTLDEPLEEDGTVVAMPHLDTDGDRAYSFVSSGGEVDGPSTTDEGDIVVDDAEVTVSATVSMSDQRTGGSSVVVDEVELSEGGFVAMHDSSLLEGATFDSVVGVSGYLGAGTHEDVRVGLDDELDEADTLIPMPHRDTNDNQEYDFVTSEGAADGPFANAAGDAVIDTAAVSPSDRATVSANDTATSGYYVSVDTVYVPEGGFVTIHDSTVLEGATFDSVRGTSDYLEPGLHRNVGVHLDEPLEEADTLVPMAHRDTNDNQEYDFVTSEGAADGPYTHEGDAVVDTARASVLAQVTFTGAEEVGDTVTVESATLHDGGFVTLHDSTVLEGAVFDSVRGTSGYLGPGTHEGVEVEVDEVPGGNDTFVAMPHRDTNGNQEYDFVTSEGAEDIPYVVGGSANVAPARVTAEATATTSISAQTTDGSTVTVDSATLSRGGFVTIHDGTLLEGEVIGSVRGTSDYLEAGSHSDVEVSLDDPYEEDGTAIAMAHRDTNGNQEYDFVDSEGASDGPYVTDGGDPVLDDAELTVESDDMDEGMTEDGDTTATDESDGDGAGFGAVVALVAVVGAVLAARRLN